MALCLPAEARSYAASACSRLLSATANILNVSRRRSSFISCLFFHRSLRFSYKLFWSYLHGALHRLSFQVHWGLADSSWFSFRKREEVRLVRVKFSWKLHECSLVNVHKFPRSVETSSHISRVIEYQVVSKRNYCRRWWWEDDWFPNDSSKSSEISSKTQLLC